MLSLFKKSNLERLRSPKPRLQKKPLRRPRSHVTCDVWRVSWAITYPSWSTVNCGITYLNVLNVVYRVWTFLNFVYFETHFINMPTVGVKWNDVTIHQKIVLVYIRLFPIKEENLLKLWTENVRITRAMWKVPIQHHNVAGNRSAAQRSDDYKLRWLRWEFGAVGLKSFNISA